MVSTLKLICWLAVAPLASGAASPDSTCPAGSASGECGDVEVDDMAFLQTKGTVKQHAPSQKGHSILSDLHRQIASVAETGLYLVGDGDDDTSGPGLAPEGFRSGDAKRLVGDGDDDAPGLEPEGFRGGQVKRHWSGGLRGTFYGGRSNRTSTAMTDAEQEDEGPAPDTDPLNGEWIDGTATYYGDSGSNGACGSAQDLGTYGAGQSWIDGYYVATASWMFCGQQSPCGNTHSYDCGRCYEVECTGSDYVASACTGQTVVVTTTDECPATDAHCSGTHNHFDLSTRAFTRIAAQNAGVISMRYRQVDCEPNGNAKLAIKGGSSRWHLECAVKDVAGAGAIEEVKVNGIALTPYFGQFWQRASDLGNGPYTFTIRTVDGQEMETTLSSITPGFHDLGTNVDSFSGGSPSPASSPSPSPPAGGSGSPSPPPPPPPPPTTTTTPAPPPSSVSGPSANCFSADGCALTNNCGRTVHIQFDCRYAYAGGNIVRVGSNFPSHLGPNWSGFSNLCMGYCEDVATLN